MKTLPLINPADGSVLAEQSVDSPERVAKKVADARRGQVDWAAQPLQTRMQIIARFRAAVQGELDELARILTRETGKPLPHCRNELNAFLGRIDFFLAHAVQAAEGAQVWDADGMREQVERIALGVVGNISAWNYPWFVGGNVFVPALLMGNAVVYKPSEFATLTGRAMARLLHGSGIPEDVFVPVYGDGSTGAALMEQPLDAVFFTGSVPTGQRIAQVVGPRMIKMQLELGGKDPTYVCPDADPVLAAQSLADGAMYNAGQSCCSVERIYVHEAIHDRFVEAVVETVRGLKMGDPMQEDTYLGPLTRAAQVGVLQAQVADAQSRGARVLIGGRRAQGPFGGQGNWFEASVLDHADHSMLLMREESFGPIVGIQKVGSDEQALSCMNDTRYGLTAGVYTPDEERARRILSRVRAGSVYWNCCDRVSPRLPWSGWGDSGLGITLSVEGISTFTRPKAWHLRSV